MNQVEIFFKNKAKIFKKAKRWVKVQNGKKLMIMWIDQIFQIPKKKHLNTENITTSFWFVRKGMQEKLEQQLLLFANFSNHNLEY